MVVAEMLPREKTQLLQLPLQIAQALQTNILTLAKTRQIVKHASPQAQQDDRMAKGYVAECYVAQRFDAYVPHLDGAARLARVHTVPVGITATVDPYGKQVRYSAGAKDMLEVDVVEFVRIPGEKQATLQLPDLQGRQNLFSFDQVGQEPSTVVSVPLLAEVTTVKGDNGVKKVQHLVSPARLATVGEVFSPHKAFAHVVVCPSRVAHLAGDLPEVQEYKREGGIIATLPFNGGDVLTALQKIHEDKPRGKLFSFD